jgi:SAM-dependent methyltransferase
MWPRKTFITRQFLKKISFTGDILITPVSDLFGTDRGTPIDRYYIEKFLSESKIEGKCLEVEEATYTLKFGKNVTSKILKYKAEIEHDSYIVADLTQPQTIPANEFDSFICTQTLNFIFEKEKAIESIHKLLRPGGSGYLTVAGISQISRYDYDRWGDFWRFTDLSLRMLLSKTFDEDKIEIRCFGNVATACLFLQGVAFEEISDKKIFDVNDPNYQMLICAKVTK